MSKVQYHTAAESKGQNALTRGFFFPVFLMLSACGSTPESTPTPTPMASPTSTPEVATPTPALWEAGESLTLTSELLTTGAITFAQGLPTETVYFVREDSLFAWDPIAQLERSFGASPGKILSAVHLMSLQVDLFTGSDGVYVIQDEELIRSPLSDALEGQGEIRALASPGPEGEDVWLATEVGLSLYRGGRLFTLNTGALPSSRATLAYGAPVQGIPSLWVSSEDALYAIVETEAGFELWDYSLGPVEGLGVTSEGILWALSEGVLWQRLPEDEWTSLELSPTPSGLVASSGSEGIWVWGSAGSWYVTPTGYRPLQTSFPAAPLGGDAHGRVLLATEAGLERQVAGRPVIFVGLENGGTLTAPIVLSVLPTLPESITELKLFLDKSPLTFDLTAPQVALDPLALAEGLHILEAVVYYPDMPEGATTELEFVVGTFIPPGWEEDIRPIYDTSCAKCHGPDSSAYQLNSAQAWRDKFDTILSYVSSQYMPLPPTQPLTDEQIYLLKAWELGGFED